MWGGGVGFTAGLEGGSDTQRNGCGPPARYAVLRHLSERLLQGQHQRTYRNLDWHSVRLSLLTESVCWAQQSKVRQLGVREPMRAVGLLCTPKDF